MLDALPQGTGGRHHRIQTGVFRNTDCAPPIPGGLSDFPAVHDQSLRTEGNIGPIDETTQNLCAANRKGECREHPALAKALLGRFGKPVDGIGCIDRYSPHIEARLHVDGCGCHSGKVQQSPAAIGGCDRGNCRSI